MEINADVNAENWLNKKYLLKDLIGILAILNDNVTNHVMLENIQIIKTVSVEKRLVDKLVEDCSENTDVKKLHPNKLQSDKMIYNSTLNDYEKTCSCCERSSSTINILLFIIYFSFYYFS